MPVRTTPIVLWRFWGLLGFCLLVPTNLLAQGGPGDVFLNGGPPALGGPYAPAPDAGDSLGDFEGGMYPGMQGALHPGMHPGMNPAMHPGVHPGMMYPGMGHGGPIGPGYGPPQRDWWPVPSYWTTFTTKIIPNSYLRVEFLNWDIDAFGSKVIGAEAHVDGVRDPSVVFLGDGTTRLAHVPHAGPLDLKENEGVRLTLGLPTRQGGAVELSYWNLLENEELYSDARAGTTDPASGLPQVIAVPMSNNGEVGISAVYFDQSFNVALTSDVSGIEVKYLHDLSPRGKGVYIQPLIGIRSNSVEEDLHIAGRTRIGASRIARISSTTDNFLIGPQVGVRFELEWWKLRFGVEPRVGGGFNFYESEVAVDNWRFRGDPSWDGEDDDVKFVGMFELGLYGKFAVHPNVTLFGGYNLLYLSRVTRPLDNIHFNDIPTSFEPLIRLTTDHSDMRIEGLTAGAEIRWR